jgi:hypothetical protein
MTLDYDIVQANAPGETAHAALLVQILLQSATHWSGSKWMVVPTVLPCRMGTTP